MKITLQNFTDFLPSISLMMEESDRLCKRAARKWAKIQNFLQNFTINGAITFTL